MSERYQDQAARMRDHVESVCAYENPLRRCEGCGGELYLKFGRWTGKYFWTHRRDTVCRFNEIGRHLFFTTRDEAEKAEQIFQ